MSTLRDDLQRLLPGALLPWGVQYALAEQHNVSLATVELAALEIGLLPARYQRNRQTLSVAQQQQLCRSRVAVIGCGGLGGYLLEQLARLGVGTLVAVDPDRFEEHNLNRQLLATTANLGQAKVAAAAERLALVNPAVTLIPHQVALSAANGCALLHEVAIAVDCLDNIPARLALSDCCAALGIPLVHGAIAGWYGQVAVIRPGAPTLRRLYRPDAERGLEQQLGNPAFTPAVIASLQATEVCKALLDLSTPLQQGVLTVDLQSLHCEVVSLG